MGVIWHLFCEDLSQSENFSEIKPPLTKDKFLISVHTGLYITRDKFLSLHITIYQVSCDAKETNKSYQNTLNPKLAYIQNSILVS